MKLFIQCLTFALAAATITAASLVTLSLACFYFCKHCY